MATTNYSGCADCKYILWDSKELPCRACKYNIDMNNRFRNKAANLFELDETEKEQGLEGKIPDRINRVNFDDQIDSFSIKVIARQVKYLAKKINEILDYLVKENGT